MMYLRNLAKAVVGRLAIRIAGDNVRAKSIALNNATSGNSNASPTKYASALTTSVIALGFAGLAAIALPSLIRPTLKAHADQPYVISSCDTETSFSYYKQMGTRFTADTTEEVSRLEGSMKRTGGLDTDVVLALYSDNSGAPDSLLSSCHLSATSIGSMRASYGCDLASPYELQSSTSYHFIISYTGSNGASLFTYYKADTGSQLDACTSLPTCDQASNYSTCMLVGDQATPPPVTEAPYVISSCNTETNFNYYKQIGTRFEAGTTEDINRLEGDMKRTGGLDADVVLALYSDNSGTPDSLLSSCHLSATSIGSTPARYGCALASPYELQANTLYHFIVSYTGSNGTNLSTYYKTDTDSQLDGCTALPACDPAPNYSMCMGVRQGMPYTVSDCDTETSFNYYRQVGTRFVPTASTTQNISHLEANLRSSGGLDADVTLAMYTGNSDYPVTLVASCTVPYTSVSSTRSNLGCGLATPYRFEESTWYHFIISYTGSNPDHLFTYYKEDTDSQLDACTAFPTCDKASDYSACMVAG